MKLQTTLSLASLTCFFCLSYFSCHSQSQQSEPLHIQTTGIERPITATDSIETTIESPDAVFVVVDEAPQFPGGPEKMVNFITQNTHLPVESEVPVTEGKVLVQFVVEKDGSLSDIKVIKGIKSSYDEECRRVFGTMPKWNPGRKGRHCVRTLIMVPLRFS